MMQIFYSLTYRDRRQSVPVGIIEHNSQAHREYIYMLSPKPNLRRVVKQDYLTNLYHFAWLLNALNDHHLTPKRLGIQNPLDWLSTHNRRTAGTILAIDDHFRISRLKPRKRDVKLSSLYERIVSHHRRKLLSNFDVR